MFLNECEGILTIKMLFPTKFEPGTMPPKSVYWESGGNALVEDES